MTDASAGWAALFRGELLPRTAMMLVGCVFFAITLQLNTTIMPTVIADLGGLEFLAWSRTLLILASIVSAAIAMRSVRWLGEAHAYLWSTAILVVGTLICAVSPDIYTMLAGRVVQGFGGGLLYALSFAVVRLDFPEESWPRAMALIQLMFGTTNLVAPAFGGLLAEIGQWRLSFFALVPLALLYTVFVWRSVPNTGRETSPGEQRLPAAQLVLVCAIVMLISMASVLPQGWAMLLCLLLAMASWAAIVGLDRRGPSALLPRLEGPARTALFTLYLLMVLVSALSAFDAYGAYFLQVIHALSPSQAGYAISLFSVAWSGVAMMSSTLHERRAFAALLVGPLLMLASFAGLFWLLPNAKAVGGATLPAICVLLTFIGTGIGLCWPHLLAYVLRLTPVAGRDRATASLTVLQQFPIAVCSAALGLLANASGLRQAGGATVAAFPAQMVVGALVVVAVIATGTALVVFAERRRAAASAEAAP